MSSDLSLALLWLLQIVMAIGLLALARQVGLLHLRVSPTGAGRLDRGPAIGEIFDGLPALTSLGGNVYRLPASKPTLVFFASSHCSLCGNVLGGVRRLSRVDRRNQFLIAVDETEEGLDYVRQYGWSDAVPANQLTMLDSGARPFACLLDSDGRVIGAGVVNTLEQTEELLSRAELTRAEVGHALSREEREAELAVDRRGEGNGIASPIHIIATGKGES